MEILYFWLILKQSGQIQSFQNSNLFHLQFIIKKKISYSHPPFLYILLRLIPIKLFQQGIVNNSFDFISMLQKRKYYLSSKQDYQLSSICMESYLHIYKHNYPQIIVRFLQPVKTKIGYNLKYGQIIFHPFYDDENQFSKSKQQVMHKDKVTRQDHVQKFEIYYPGQIILNKQSDIFNQYFKREVLSALDEKNNSKKTKKKNVCNKDVNTQNSCPKISQYFQILLREWLNDGQINVMFLISQKHQQSFQSFDHGFIQLEVLKSSGKTMKIQFYQDSSQKKQNQKQTYKLVSDEQNNKTYFQFNSSIFYKQQPDCQQLKDLGFVIPKPLTVNQFFFQCLIMMFEQFQGRQNKKTLRIKRKQQEQRIKLDLLQKYTGQTIQYLIPFKTDTSILQESVDNEDSLDKKLNYKQEHLRKLNNNINTLEISMISHISANQIRVDENMESKYQYSPENNIPQKSGRSLSKREQQQQKRYRLSTTRNNMQKAAQLSNKNYSDFVDVDEKLKIKDVFEDEPKKKRRFITKAQEVKIQNISRRLMSRRDHAAKDQIQQNKATKLNYNRNNYQHVQLVVRSSKNQPIQKRSVQSSTHRKAQISNLADDYFSIYQQATIVNKDEQSQEHQHSLLEQEDQHIDIIQ